jgi:class 3 adenylate cyclase
MGNKPSGAITDAESIQPAGLRRVLACFGLKKEDVVEIHSRKPGMVSREAVQWFIDRDLRTFGQSISFVPRILRRGFITGKVSESTHSVVAYRGDGAVVFCDASGFTKLTESLAQKPNGAELLSSVLNQFFTPLIEIIQAYRGDIIKFSGDALTILFIAEQEYSTGEDPGTVCGSEWARCSGHSELELAVLRASACCLEIHKRLDDFETGVDDKRLSFHIGVGCGSCSILHLGGNAAPEDPKTRRFEYVLSGEPLEQIAHACKYAEVYETVLSPRAWDLVKDTVIEGTTITQDPAYKRLAGFVTSKHTYATIRAAAEAHEGQFQDGLQLHHLNMTRRYIPSAVFQQMANGTLDYVNEIRNVTVFFICVAGLDVSSNAGATTAQDLMSSVQQACFQQEGQVNKFLVDDKGLLFLCVFGTPPLVHTDDPLRAINACFSIIHSLKRLGLVGHFGLSTGRVFCGMVGSSARQEYTTLGDSVNLAARLMQLGCPNVVIVDEAAYEQTKGDLDYEILEPVRLKGKNNLIRIFKPQPKQLIGSILAPQQTPLVAEDEGKAPYIRRNTRVTEMIESSVATNDPLVECTQWRELKLTKRCLDEAHLVSEGGTLVLGGASGLGKDQLSQYIIQAAREQNKNSVAVYATDRGLPKDRARPIIELLETGLSVAESCGIVDPDDNKLELLAALIGEPVSEIASGALLNDSNMIEMPLLSNYSAGTSLDPTPGMLNRPAPTKRLSRFLSLREDQSSHQLSAREMEVPFEDQFIDYCVRLVLKILETRPLVVIMRISRGTSLFNIVNNPTFWKLANRMSELSLEKKNLTVIILCRSIEHAVAGGLPPGAQRIELQPLTRNSLEEYMWKILRLDSEEEAAVPSGLIDFIEDLTQGNPLYVLETLEQLVSRNYVSRSSHGFLSVNVSDLRDKVSVADWNHTAMVGKVICQLEALAPQEAAIVKMASVFQGPFSVLDIAASLKSPFLNAQRFDNYRMYRTCVRLVKMGILSDIPQYVPPSATVPVNDLSRFPKDTDEKFIQSIQNIPMFFLDNLLIRKVANGMVLHQQALKIKRQALMHRVIFRDVGERIRAQKERLQSLHTPYFNLVKLS